ncbi:MAG: hypothetical protein AAF532_10205 [Planctomycetota bacterium]
MPDTAPLTLTVASGYKPPVPPAKARDVGGVFAVRSEDTNQKWPMLIGSVLCGAVSAVAGFFAFGGIDDWIPWAFAGVFFVVFGLVAFGLAASFVKAVRIESVFKRGELLLSGWPVAPGQTVTARFHQQLKGGVQLNGIQGRLLIRETARYRVGTSTHTATEETPVDTFDEVAADGADGVLRADYELKIPSDAACSFKAPDNELAWILEVIVDAEGFPDAKSAFPIRVADGV